ncbi:MAG: MotA/TolQ/ExbB proton channel family protein [Candidatus Hydrogenedentes bacterium]|nr:MotA/TolQ/ExbB proton channel family protein [Candidatus Hydrogenedentota bacterium]
MIEFACPHCRSVIQATDRSAGAQVTCPHCDRLVLVPSPGRGTAPPPQPAATAGTTRTAPEPPAMPSGVSRSGSHTQRLRIGSGSQRIAALLHMASGVVLAVLFYSLLKAFSSTGAIPPAFAEKFLDRGWTPYVSVFLMFWAFSILFGRCRHILRCRRALRANYIDATASFRTESDVQDLIARTRALSKELKDCILGSRIRRALEHYRATRDVAEVGEILRDESESAYNLMQSSYTLVRVFLWAIPILGFIGTVVGVGSAVGGFAQFLAGAQEVDQIKTALGSVTSGLGVAFDTTFVGLLLSVVLMVVMSWVEKAERDHLLAFEDYCTDHLLRRLPAHSSQSEHQTLATAIRSALRDLVPGIDTWKEESRQLSQALAESLRQAWKESGAAWFEGLNALHKRMAAYTAQFEKLQAATAQEHVQLRDDTARLVGEMKAMLGEEREHVRGLLDAEQKSLLSVLRAEQDGFRAYCESEKGALQGIAAGQQQMVREYAALLTDVAGKLGSLVTLQNNLEGELLKAAGSDGLVSTMGQVKGLLASLDPVLHKLADKPLDVQVQFMAAPTVVQGRMGDA